MEYGTRHKLKYELECLQQKLQNYTRHGWQAPTEGEMHILRVYENEYLGTTVRG